MKAAVLVRQREPLALDRLEVPDGLDHGQVRVRVHYSGICGSQLGEIDGVKGPDRWLPHLLGHEGSGTVEDVGPGVTTVASGDRVVLHWMRGAGIEAAPPSYSGELGTVNAGWVTTFNERAVVSENRVTRIDEDFPLELAPLLGCAVTTGTGVVVNDAAVRVGESVVVWGAGGVGLSVVQAAALAGADPIVAIDLHRGRLDLARRLGATHALEADAAADLTGIVGERGADVIVENTGNPRVIEQAYEATAPDGRTILVGVPPKDDKVSIYTLPLHFGKTLKGSFGGGARPDVDIPRYVQLYRSGRLDLESLITDRYPLERINDAIEDMRSGRTAGRCLIEVSPP